MKAVESDSAKSARKAKDKLHKPFKERQKLVSELCTARNKTMRIASMRESRDSDRFLVNTHKYNHMHCCIEGLAVQCLSFVSVVGNYPDYFL